MKKKDDVSSQDRGQEDKADQSGGVAAGKNSRRKFVAGVTTGTAAALGAATTGRWVKPVVDSVVLPAHAQTSGNLASSLVGRLVVTEPDADDPAYSKFSFGDGVHTVDGFNDTNGIDDTHFEFQAEFQPPIDPAVEVKLEVQTDGDFDFDMQGFTRKANVSGSKVLETVDSDDAPDDAATIVARFTAPGYPTRKVSVKFNP